MNTWPPLTTGVPIKWLRLARPPSTYFDSLGLQSNFQSNSDLPSLLPLGLKLYNQPSPPPNSTCGTPPSTAYAGLDHWPCSTLVPGELSVQMTLPVFLSRATKLGALGAGRLICPSSTPLDVLTNSRSPAAVTEQLAMLCCETPSCFIMLSFQMTSASSVSSTPMTL